MADGTCTLTIAETAGGIDDPVPNARVLTLATAQHNTGTYSVSLQSAQLATNPIASPLSTWVQSVSSRFALTDGTIYNFTLGCEDVAGNTFESTTVSNLLFAGSSTIAPVLSSPVAAGCISESSGTGNVFTHRKCAGGSQRQIRTPRMKLVGHAQTMAELTANTCSGGGDSTSIAACIGRGVFEFTFLEPPQAGTVSVTLTPTTGCGTIVDNSGARVLTLGDISTAGTFSFSLSVPLSGLVAAEAYVTAIGGAGGTSALVDGMFYDVEISYQDSIGNPAASIVSSGVSFWHEHHCSNTNQTGQCGSLGANVYAGVHVT